jgi:cadmium resistance protein CadD (predicted permease)
MTAFLVIYYIVTAILLIGMVIGLIMAILRLIWLIKRDKDEEEAAFESLLKVRKLNRDGVKLVQMIDSMSGEQVIKMLFRKWRDEYDRDVKVDQAMREKIKKEFNVDIE